MSYTSRVDALHRWPVDGPGVRALRVALLRALWLVIVVAEHASPLLHCLLVVLGSESSIGTSVIDLHLGSRSSVSRIHVLGNVCPHSGSVDGFSVSTCGVPGIDTT